MTTTLDQMLDDLASFSVRVARRLDRLEAEVEHARRIALDALDLAGELAGELAAELRRRQAA